MLPDTFDMADIFVVIPVHNRKQLTLSCLHSLEEQSVRGFRVVVVNDGSTDGSEEVILSQFPDVTVLKGNGNLWWSGGMNFGVEYALGCGAKYILSLNNDLEVASDYVEKMVFWAIEKPEALFGSYTFDIKGRQPHFGGSRIDWHKCKAVPLLDILPKAQRKGIHSVTHLPGRGLWVPAKVFNAIGLFDAKRLPQYAADYDFTLRAREHGFELFCNFDSRVYSHVDASFASEVRKKYSMQNYLRNLFSIRGTGNLEKFTIFCFRHCPKRFLIKFWLYGILARIGGYLRDWLRESYRKT